MSKKILIISLIFGLTILTLVSFWVYPFLKEIREDSAEIVEIKRNIISSKDKISRFGEIEKTYESLKGDLEKTEELFVASQAPINLIQFWEKTAAESNISIDISPFTLMSPETDPWNSISFQLNLDGSFSNFLKFLEKIENGPYLIEIKNLAIKKQSKKEPEAKESLLPSNVTVTLLTKIYTK